LWSLTSGYTNANLWWYHCFVFLPTFFVFSVCFFILGPSWIDTVWGFFFPTKPFPAGCWDWPGAGIPPKKAEFVRNDNPERGWISTHFSSLFVQVEIFLWVRLTHLLIGLKWTSRPVPVVREFSNVRILDFLFFFSFRTFKTFKVQEKP
jgi:hypothetical protein